jgi:hypothetical protein
MIVKQYELFDVVYGISEDVFDYIGEDNCYGLKKSECYDHVGDVYIAGLVNVNHEGKPFMFINKHRMETSSLSDQYGLVYHESVHMAMILMDGDVKEYEEDFAELVVDIANHFYEHQVEVFQDEYSK